MRSSGMTVVKTHTQTRRSNLRAFWFPVGPSGIQAPLDLVARLVDRLNIASLQLNILPPRVVEERRDIQRIRPLHGLLGKRLQAVRDDPRCARCIGGWIAKIGALFTGSKRVGCRVRLCERLSTVSGPRRRGSCLPATSPSAGRPGHRVPTSSMVIATWRRSNCSERSAVSCRWARPRVGVLRRCRRGWRR